MKLVLALAAAAGLAFSAMAFDNSNVNCKNVLEYNNVGTSEFAADVQAMKDYCNNK